MSFKGSEHFLHTHPPPPPGMTELSTFAYLDSQVLCIPVQGGVGAV